ncbi:MAG: NHLP-related RiPP peptide [Arenimonas sp.]
MTFEHSEHVLDKTASVLEDAVNPAFHISEEITDMLLDKLSSDEEFRAVFLRSPRIALAYLGHEAATNASPSDEGAWRCLQCTQLASAETIKNSHKELRMQLLSARAAYNPVNLQR